IILSEKESWRKTSFILVLLSIIIGVIQRSQYQFLDEIFEIFIFHIPAVISLIIYNKVPQQ
ncbi:hypothetical protein MUP51_02205, partial [Candidatus Bathyarchaeota archaeon]|nr:hypothetical protein [Candidatus Bathyarchaeota archaeon]